MSHEPPGASLLDEPPAAAVLTRRRWLIAGPALLALAGVWLMLGPLSAQAPPRLSRHRSVSQNIAAITVTVDYNRPVARGRSLFGQLVPWGRVWCPGADDCTTIDITGDVLINKMALRAGRYSLWMEPQADQWTVIFNKVQPVFHTRYPAGQDALRVTAMPRTASHVETLAFYFPVVEGRHAELVLHWGTVVVPISIDVP